MKNNSHLTIIPRINTFILSIKNLDWKLYLIFTADKNDKIQKRETLIFSLYYLHLPTLSTQT